MQKELNEQIKLAQSKLGDTQIRINIEKEKMNKFVNEHPDMLSKQHKDFKDETANLAKIAGQIKAAHQPNIMPVR